MKIYIARHGQTVWNSEGKMHSRYDGNGTDLTEKGVQHAAKIGKLLSNADIEIIYNSGMKRTIETSAIMSEYILGPPVVSDSRLKDVCLGWIDGITSKEFREKYPDIVKSRVENPFGYTPPNLFPKRTSARIENYSDALLRVAPLIDDIQARNENTLIVSHRGISKIILYYLLKDSQFTIPKNDVQKLQMKNEMIYRVTAEHDRKNVEYYDFNINNWTHGVLYRPKENF